MDTARHYVQQQAGGDAASFQKPPLSLWALFRLSLYFFAQGVLLLLVLGVLNRIMIDKNLLGIPASISTGCMAMLYVVAITRLWFGKISDSKKFLGYQRTGYIWLGVTLEAVSLFIALQIVWKLGADPTNALWVILLGLSFALYGMFKYLSSVACMALLVDISDENNRNKIMGVAWA